MEQAFWQVNLLLVPPPALPFYLHTRSYGFVRQILISTVKFHAVSFTLRNDCLILTHWPYYKRTAPIEIILTTDIDAFFEWLGLNTETWNAGFETEKDVWKWLVDCNPQTFGRACGMMAAHHVWEKVNSGEAEIHRRYRTKERMKRGSS